MASASTTHVHSMSTTSPYTKLHLGIGRWRGAWAYAMSLSLYPKLDMPTSFPIFSSTPPTPFFFPAASFPEVSPVGRSTPVEVSLHCFCSWTFGSSLGTFSSGFGSKLTAFATVVGTLGELLFGASTGTSFFLGSATGGGASHFPSSFMAACAAFSAAQEGEGIGVLVAVAVPPANPPSAA
eukprot:CAMPEP_0180223950 /NCGR_PEP_ID=MMETSP0987-20121128/21756_1 /TAXON_ID=697907 /ORGANISM="non described non described, Strain CCMP2293" /LENGTH=180 /DNA_ID=CAMNT_0022186617 /DNA_START=845 /DNA_END=1384 /DNA_ORIENTATION=-